MTDKGGNFTIANDNYRSWRGWASRWLAIGCWVHLGILVLLLGLYQNNDKTRDQKAMGLAGDRVDAASDTLDKRFKNLQRLATSIAEDLTAGILPPNQIADRLKSSYEEDSLIFEVGVVYVPAEGFDPPRGPHYGGNVQDLFDLIHDVYPYTEYGWYRESLKNALEKKGAPTWYEPYLGGATHTLVAGVCVPFYDPERKEQIAGFARVNFSLKDIENEVAKLGLGKTGYGFLLSNAGIYLSHPLQDRIAQSVFAIAADSTLDPARQEAMRDLGDLVESGREGMIYTVNEITGHSAWMISRPIASTGWSVGGVLNKDEILHGGRTLHRQRIWIGMVLISMLFFLSMQLLSRSFHYNVRQLWIGCGVSSVLSVVGIAFIWYLVLDKPIYGLGVPLSDGFVWFSTADDWKEAQEADGNIIFDEKTLNRFMAQRDRHFSNLGERPIYIPTGVFIQSLEFTSANNVLVSGYLWQK